MPSAPERIGIVGASGYVGHALVESLRHDPAVRLSLFGRRETQVRGIPVQVLGAGGLQGLDCIIHLAAVTNPRASDADLQTANLDLAVSVARQAIAGGVRRFVFVSSIGVHGRCADHPIAPDTPFAPADAYARSKACAEAALSALADGSGLDLVILRPPMIYGPGCEGRFSRLARLVGTGLPLPFANACGRRSFCSLANIVSALRFAAQTPSPPKVLIPGDPEDFDTAGLVRTIAAATGRPVALYGPPHSLTSAVFTLLRRPELDASLFGSLRIDRRHWAVAGWTPVETGTEAVRRAVTPHPPSPTVLYVATDTAYFLSHRLSLAREARRRGFRILLTAPDTEAHLSTLQAEQIAPVPVSHVVRGLDPLADMRAAFGIGHAIRRTRPEVVHCSGLKALFLCALAGWTTPLPRVVCLVTGLGSLYVGNSVGRRLARLGVEAVLRPLLRRPDTVTIFQNRDDLACFVAKRIVREGDARLILGSGVDVDAYPFSAEPASGPPLVIFPARLLRSKGVLAFAQAAALLRARGVSARFALVGDLDPGSTDSLTPRELGALQTEGDMEVWGRRSDMSEVFAQSHVVCLPSAYREGVPRALIEAASVGRAIVTTDTPGCREIVIDGLNGRLVPPHDPRALAAALETLIGDPKARRRMGLASRRRVEASFSSAIVNRATADLYEGRG